MARSKHPKMADWYIAYLNSPHWHTLRTTILDKRTRKCEDCGSRYKPTLHHLSYARLGHERQSDMRILCPRHHRLAHRLHDIPFLFLIYRENKEGDVDPILTVNRGALDFEYPRLRVKKEK